MVQRWFHLVALGGLTLAVAACGPQPGTPGPSSAPNPSKLKASVLKAISSWQGVSVQFQDSVQQGGHLTQYQVDLRAEKGAWQLTVNGGGLNQVEASYDGNAVVVRQPGGAPPVVLPALSASPALFRLFMPDNFSALMQSASINRASLESRDVARLDFTGTLAGGAKVDATLWFDLNQGIPQALRIANGGVTVEEKVSHFATQLANGPLSLPLPPATPVTVAEGQGATLFSLASAEVHFPALVPPSAANLKLLHVDSPPGSTPSVLLLQYQAPDGSPLLVSERMGAPTLPQGATVVSRSDSGFTVEEALLPRGQAFEAVNFGNLWVAMEGPTTAVEEAWSRWLAAWSSAPATPSSAP